MSYRTAAFQARSRRCLALLVGLTVALSTQAKPRVLALTDMGCDPDDEESMVRFLLYSNQFDVEGLIAITSTWKRSNPLPSYIHTRIDAYEKVRNSLLKHDPDYPTADYLRSIVRTGQTGYGMGSVGDGKSSGGSNLIVEAVDRDDPRPVWVTIWGGANTLAQALWDVKKSRSPEQVDDFVSKLRVYDVCGQDEAGAWGCNEFNAGGRMKLFWIRAFENFKAISYDVNGEFPDARGGNETLVSPQWFSQNVQNNHGALGVVYPNAAHLHEGDTPSFLHLMSPGLSDPEHPEYGGWGGRYEWMEMWRINYVAQLGVPAMYNINEATYKPFWMFSEVDDHWEYGGKVYDNVYCSLFRWREAYQNEFAARMDWCVNDYAGANHSPIAVVNGDKTTDILYADAKIGEGYSLDAGGSSDPDGDDLSYNWWVYPEPGTYDGEVTIDDATSRSATLNVPSDALDRTIHVILELTDGGSPKLFSFRRVVVTGREDVKTSCVQPARRERHVDTAPAARVLPRGLCRSVNMPADADGFRVYTLAGKEVFRWKRGPGGTKSAARAAVPEHLRAAPFVLRYELSSKDEQGNEL